MAQNSEEPVKKKRRLYSADSLRRAYEAVMIDDMSIYAASREFGVPERTLGDRCKGLVPLECKPGSSHLTLDEEKKLCNLMKQLFFAGNDMTYTYMRHVATDFIRGLEKKTLKPGVVVTKKWMSAFLKRWPDFKKMLHSKAVVKIEVKYGNEESNDAEIYRVDVNEDSEPEKGEEIENSTEVLSEIESSADKPEPELEAQESEPATATEQNIEPEEMVSESSSSKHSMANTTILYTENKPFKTAPVVYRANIKRHKTETNEVQQVADTGNARKVEEKSSSGIIEAESAEITRVTTSQTVASETLSVSDTPLTEVSEIPMLMVPSTSVSPVPNTSAQNVTLVLNQEKKKKRNYPNEAMIQAYEAVKNGGMKVYRAADLFGVPEKTLAERIAGKVPVDAKSGPRFYLTHDEEKKLCQYFTDRLMKGETLTHKMMRDIAAQFMQELDIKRKTDSKLTSQWLSQYLKRWPELDELVREKMAMKQVSKKMDSLYAYYEELSSLLMDFGLDESPQQIYMIEEIEIPSVLNNFKPVTVIAGANALGQVIPPYIVYKVMKANSDMIEGIPDNAKIALEQAEVTKFDRLQAYLEAHFSQSLFERDPSKPVLVFYESHKNNLPRKITDWANSNNVFLNDYPPPDVKHFTHVDCKLLGTFEWKFREACLRFSQMTRQKVTKKQISALTCNAYASALSADAVQLVFSSAGIHPYSCPMQAKESEVSIIMD